MADSNIHFSRRLETALTASLLGVLVVLLVPLPTVLLDMLLALNLGLSILLMLLTLSVRRPLDLSVFPSLLLLLTLFRLSLNVASTRLILLDGDAGRIVETFGGFVVGGNLVVGLVIFLILVLIQFLVITKGASRVSEVAARFALDSLPGKQMAIDADLGARAIDEKEARRRRDELAREAEFHGAMDGASKFVRGDAIAGLVVTGINLVGGVALGLFDGMPVTEALRQYSVLTVGDGLISQIPALIIATTSGLLVTKTGSKVSLSDELGEQLLTNPRVITSGAVVLGLVALAPGLPKLPFLAMSGILWFLGRRPAPKPADPSASTEPPPTDPVVAEQQMLAGFVQTDRVAVELGKALTPLIESKRVKGLADRVRKLREDLNREHGQWVPSVRLFDSTKLPPEGYRLLIGGHEVGRGEIRTGLFLAINPGEAQLSIEGEETRDPTFGLPAKWIDPSVKMRAELAGYTVVDAPSVLLTHLGEMLRRHAHELLTLQDLKRLVDQLRATAPSLVEELRPDTLRITTFHQVLLALLAERVPITDLELILETVLHHAVTTKSPLDLADAARGALGRSICDRFRDESGKLRLLVLDPRVETRLRDSMRDGEVGLPPRPLEKLLSALGQHWQKAQLAGHEAALLCGHPLRRPLRNLIVRALPDLAVLSYREIPADLLMEPVAMIRMEDVYDDARAEPLAAA